MHEGELARRMREVMSALSLGRLNEDPLQSRVIEVIDQVVD
jgi:hypothetical protein